MPVADEFHKLKVSQIEVEQSWELFCDLYNQIKIINKLIITYMACNYNFLP